MSYFDFKQFRVYHDRCAMKVGTDGVLLGAWAPVVQAQRILDIGTGTGLVALMLAQRSEATIVGVELDKDAAQQATENVHASTFAQRIKIVNADILDYNNAQRFDAIVSNPPFFQNALECPELGRSRARHTASLPLDALIDTVCKLLVEGGTFAVILPTDVAEEFMGTCISNHLFPNQITAVKTVPRKSPKRMLMSFIKEEPNTELIRDEIILATATGERSEQYRALTNEFYLEKRN